MTRNRAAHARALRSGAFRFALVLAAVFAIGSAVLLWAVAWQVGGFAGQATEAMIRSESVVLVGEYRQLGLSGLTDALTRHSQADAEAPYHYLLVDSRQQRLFGDLPMSAAQVGWGSIPEVEPGGGASVLRRYGTALPGGLLLVVATDAFDVETLRYRLVAFTLASGIAITLFALVGGYLAGRVFLRRLDRINHAVARIIDGGGESLPAIGVGPEFDQLTRNLNLMLDRKADAMEALRHVSTAIAHDLRTPLTGVRQNLELLRDKQVPDPADVDGVIEQVDEILATFQALLRIGMIEGGVGRQRFTEVDLSAVVRRVCEIYQPVAEDAEHAIRLQETDGVMVEGDAELLTQLFTNLLENAIVHTPTRTLIEVTLRLAGDEVVLRVADNGPGIAIEHAERIFRRFYRGDESRGSPGAGLGLSLVAAIATLHGGRYQIVPGDRGLTIEIVLARLMPPEDD